jgi:hypothetical protein
MSDATVLTPYLAGATTAELEVVGYVDDPRDGAQGLRDLLSTGLEIGGSWRRSAAVA